MPASVANSLVTHLLPATSASQQKGTEASGAGDVFTRHLEQAQGAVKRDASPSSPPSTDRKSHKSGTAAKGAQKAKKPADAEDADAAPAEDASNGAADVVEVAAVSAVEDVPAAKAAKEPKAAPAAKSDPSQVDSSAALSLPTIAPLNAQPTPATKPQDSAATAPGTVEALTPEQNTAEHAAPPTDAAAEASNGTTPADAKVAKTAGRPAVRAASPLDDVTVAPPKASAAKSPAVSQVTSTQVTAEDAAAAVPPPTVELEKPAPAPAADGSEGHWLAAGVSGPPSASTTHAAPVASQAAPLPPEVRFAETNHVNIVSSVQASLLPHGGTMQIRLDPPELGALQVTVEMRNGTMSATFQTSNEDATRLLSHSMGQLKTALEAQGVTVDKIQVQQAPKDQQSQNNEGSSQQQLRDEANARQEQQRREMLERMWRRVSGTDPVDLVA